MKKITELAKNVFDEFGYQYNTDSLTELKEWLEHRKALEQTPITEKWLIEQGFVVSDELHSKRDKIYVKNEIKVFLDVDCINGTVGNADCIEIIKGCSCFFHKDNYDNRHEITLADLMDAIEICK